MTPTEAREFADNLQERVNQMGERTGEGMHLGRCLSVIRGLASQIEALTPPDAEVSAAPPTTRKKERKKAAAETVTIPPVIDNAPPRLDE